MKTSHLILIGAVAAAVITTIAVFVFETGSEENESGAQKEQSPATQQNGVPDADKGQGSGQEGGIGDGDFD